MLFTPRELLDLIIMVFAIGFIFSKIIKKPISMTRDYDPLAHYSRKSSLYDDIKWGIIVAAPAVVFHEFAHKFVAISFGATAILHAPLTMYAIVILMIMLNFPLIFFVGGYVQIIGMLTPLQSAIVSFAGPGTNLLIWIIMTLSLKSNSKFVKKNVEIFAMSKKINMFLFVFNMIPIPGFDGFNFFSSIFKYFGGLF